MGSGVEQAGHGVGSVQQLLEVVQDHQHLPLPDMLMEGVEDRPHPFGTNADGVGHARRDQAGIGDRREVHEEHAVRIVLEELTGGLQRQPGLSASPRAGEREEARPPGELLHPGHLSFPAHEARPLSRKIGRHFQRPGRGKVGGKAVDRHVVEALSVVEVLETVRPEIPERHCVGENLLDQSTSGPRDQDLAPIGRRGDPSREVHVDAKVVVAAQDALAGVHPHPDQERSPPWPLVAREGALSGNSGQKSAGRPREHREEGVPLGADLHAVAFGDGLPHQRGVVVLDAAVLLAELLEQPGGSLNIREQEGHGPGRQSRGAFGHPVEPVEISRRPTTRCPGPSGPFRRSPPTRPSTP